MIFFLMKRTYSRGSRYIVRSMFLTVTQQLTWDFADSIHTFPNRYTTPRPQSTSNINICSEEKGEKKNKKSTISTFPGCIHMPYLVGCMGLQRHPANRSERPAPHPSPLPVGGGWSPPALLQELHHLHPHLGPKSLQVPLNYKREKINRW